MVRQPRQRQLHAGDPQSSGISQGDYAFTNLFKVYTEGGSEGSLWPMVEITKPIDGQAFADNPVIIFEADANDSDGSITQVEYIRGDTYLGAATQSPYRAEWAHVPAGNHQLKTVATDDQGGATVSTVVSIKITGVRAALVTDSDYPAGIGTYQSGQQVQNNGSIYKVREYPHGGWADINDPFLYEPGVGIAWQDAWYHVGLCP